MKATRCRSCGQPIVWMLTAAGKAMPVNYTHEAEQDAREQKVYDRARHVTHYGTCPQAKQWSRRSQR